MKMSEVITIIVTQGDDKKTSEITKGQLISTVHYHLEQLRFLFPAYKKTLFNEESEEFKFMAEKIMKLIPLAVEGRDTNLNPDELIDALNKLNDGILSHATLMDKWLGREVKVEIIRGV